MFGDPPGAIGTPSLTVPGPAAAPFISQSHVQIEALLQKLSAVEQRLFEGSEAVRGSEGEADTKPLVASLMAMAEEINEDIKQRCTARP